MNASQVEPSLYVESNYSKEWRFNYANIPSEGNAELQVRLYEVSSSTNNLLSDIEGHFTTLSRNVQTQGPDVRLFVAWPSADGETIGEGYLSKAYFSKAYADGLSNDELLEAIVITVDGTTISRDEYQINYNLSLIHI